MNFGDAIGLSTYSNSKPTVPSYIAIFENFLSHIKLYDQLKLRDTTQKEFTNVAGHEMRIPIQALFWDIRELEQQPEKSNEIIQAMKRNACRLNDLTEDILDVTRIESRTFKLNKERYKQASICKSGTKKSGIKEEKERRDYVNSTRQVIVSVKNSGTDTS